MSSLLEMHEDSHESRFTCVQYERKLHASWCPDVMHAQDSLTSLERCRWPAIAAIQGQHGSRALAWDVHEKARCSIIFDEGFLMVVGFVRCMCGGWSGHDYSCRHQVLHCGRHILREGGGPGHRGRHGHAAATAWHCWPRSALLAYPDLLPEEFLRVRDCNILNRALEMHSNPILSEQRVLFVCRHCQRDGADSKGHSRRGGQGNRARVGYFPRRAELVRCSGGNCCHDGCKVTYGCHRHQVRHAALQVLLHSMIP